MIVTVIIFVFLLSVLVLVHEFGHLVAAKKLGVKIEEFGIGLPPKIVKIFSWRKTEFSLNWLPLGGFVRMSGEERDLPIPRIIARKMGQFWAQKIWKRTIILLAGVSMNLVLAIILFSISYTALGIPTKTNKVFVDAVAYQSPAENAGLKPGDQILEIISRNQSIIVTDTDKFIETVSQNLGQEISLKIISNDITAITIINIIPRLKEETPEGQGALGIVVSNIEMVHYPWWQMPFRASFVGLKEAVLWGAEILMGLVKMLQKLIFLGQVPTDVAGPVGIAAVTGKVAAQGIIALLQFAGVLSVNLAMINVLPIPALDGGHLLFLAIEKVRGRPINPKKEHWANMIGYIILIGMIILISIRDVLRLLKI